MLDFIDTYLLTPYVQVFIFVIVLSLFWIQHRKFKLASSGFSWVRTIILLALFGYFAWNWATSISNAITKFSVLGMFFINLYMVYNLLLSNLDEKYRLALDDYGRDITNKEALARVWSTGKNYMYSRYFFDSLFSGFHPGGFLKAIVNRQIPADIDTVMAKSGFKEELVNLQNLIAYVNLKLVQSPDLPQGLRDVLDQTIKAFGAHAWIQEQVDEFLRLALKDPEKLYQGAWKPNPPEINPKTES